MKRIAKAIRARSLRYREVILSGREHKLDELAKALRDREQAIFEKEEALIERDKAIHARELALSERNDAIKDRDKAIKDAFIDSLTNCYNRNYFNKVMSENDNADLNHKKIALIFIDINDLKKTNDELGHDAGDRLIRETADFLRLNFRKKFDTVIRLGGDEFVVICYNYRENDFFEEALIKKVSDCRVCSPLCFAFGVAVFDKSIDDSLDDTKNRADERMYKCKGCDKKRRQGDIG